ncbi:MAG: hypothetical protein AAGA18_12335 [Verrucomicrobiota bacterium]
MKMDSIVDRVIYDKWMNSLCPANGEKCSVCPFLPLPDTVNYLGQGQKSSIRVNPKGSFSSVLKDAQSQVLEDCPLQAIWSLDAALQRASEMGNELKNWRMLYPAVAWVLSLLTKADQTAHFPPSWSINKKRRAHDDAYMWRARACGIIRGKVFPDIVNQIVGSSEIYSRSEISLGLCTHGYPGEAYEWAVICSKLETY